MIIVHRLVGRAGLRSLSIIQGRLGGEFAPPRGSGDFYCLPTQHFVLG